MDEVVNRVDQHGMPHCSGGNDLARTFELAIGLLELRKFPTEEIDPCNSFRVYPMLVSKHLCDKLKLLRSWRRDGQIVFDRHCLLLAILETDNYLVR